MVQGSGSAPEPSDQAAVDQFQGKINAQAEALTETGLRYLFDGNIAAAMVAFDEAKAVESAPVAASGGGGYRFNPFQIEEQLKQCEDLIQGLRQTGLANAATIARTRSPAQDTVASVPQASATQELGQRLIQRIENQVTFIQNWQDQLKKVRQNYLDQEGHDVTTWKALSGGKYT